MTELTEELITKMMPRIKQIMEEFRLDDKDQVIQLLKENYKEVHNAAKDAGRDPSNLDYVYDCFIAIDNENPQNAVKRCEFFKVAYLLNPNKVNQAYPNLKLPEDLTIHNFLMDSEGAADLLKC